MEFPIQQCRSSLQGCVNPRLTVSTSRRVPHVGNKDDRQTVAARQTGKPLKHRLSSLLVIYVVPLLSAIQYIVYALFAVQLSNTQKKTH